MCTGCHAGILRFGVHEIVFRFVFSFFSNWLPPFVLPITYLPPLSISTHTSDESSIRWLYSYRTTLSPTSRYSLPGGADANFRYLKPAPTTFYRHPARSRWIPLISHLENQSPDSSSREDRLKDVQNQMHLLRNMCGEERMETDMV